METAAQDKLDSILRTHAEKRVFEDFRHYHVSVSQKLWSVDYYCDNIAQLKPVTSYERMSRSPASDLADGKMVAEGSTYKSFLLSMNMFLDGFLMNAVAALDTLAHEIWVIYKGSKSGDLYMNAVKKELKKCHPKSQLVEHLEEHLAEDWFDTLRMYRRCTTHESLVAPDISFKISLITGEVEQSIPLPDDPTNRPFTYAQKRELITYCEEARKKVKLIVDRSYICIVEDLIAADNKVPIPASSLS
jgi:hypothetical protein